MYVGQLRSAGLAKEMTVGTVVTTPDRYIRYIPPDSFFPTITLLESMGIDALPDMVTKVSQGPGEVKGAKIKVEVEPENIGEMLMATFGTDTPAEVASFIVSAGVNDKIDFKESGGSQDHATLTAGTYIAGANSGVAGSLCALIKAQMQSAGSGIYTVTYSYTTKKFTIAIGTGTVQILWLTGTNTATSARTLLGFTDADTADASSVTSDSTSQQYAFAHTFTRLAAAQLPTYSWWFDKGADIPMFPGSMMSKFEMDVKAKEFVTADTEWIALSYDGSSGSSKSPTYSHLKPFVFNQAAVSVDGSPILNYDNLKISIDNHVKADHALSGSIYPAKIYSEGMMVTLSAELFFEDTTQYAKFIAGTSASFTIALTSAQDIVGAVPYKLTVNLPNIYYQSANHINPKGILKIPFVARGVYDTATTKTINMVLQNSIATSY